MKVTSAWIKESLGRTMLDDHHVVEALERAGIEIEQVSYSTEIDERVVIALVKEVVQHPGADRLKLVKVETGEGEYGIVCGAPNVREGMKVALAQIGTTLPSGDVIEKVKLRGEVSEGMLCSELELGIGQDHAGIIELSNEAVIGRPVKELYPADTVIDIKTPANRWDVQSVVGLAREVAAMTGENQIQPTPPAVRFSANTGIFADNLLASRYMLGRVAVNQHSPSPALIVSRLKAAGVRSIGPVVDVTNYVMLETGQPLHAFDSSRVTLPIAVRHAAAGETLTTLDGLERSLSAADLVIADAKGPIALAGLMGGKSSEVTADTTEILLESAVFDGVTVRKMAKRHGLRTEASARFERGLPSALPPLGLGRAIELLGEAAEGNLEAAYDAPFEATKPWSIALSLSRLNELLGFGVLHKEAVAALGRLGIEAEGDDDHIVVPAVPWWRPDLKEPADLVEEIVRVIGYDNVPSTIPAWRPTHIEFDRRRNLRRRVRDIAWAAGAFEVMTYSFVSAEQLTGLGLDLKAHLKLKNPLSVEQAYLRSNLLPSHLATLERNRMYAKTMKFSEISNVFVPRAAREQPDEPLLFGVTVLEAEGGYASAKGLLDAVARELGIEFEFKAGMQEAYAQGRYAEVWLGRMRVGGIGEIHPARVRAMKLEGEVAHFEVDLGALMAASVTSAYVPVSTYPTITRDIALLVPAEATWQALRAAAAGLDVSFVSDYYGEELEAGTKSITIRLRLALPDRTPTEAEAADYEQTVLARLSHKIGAKRRN